MALEVEDTDAAVLEHQRHDQFRPHAGHHANVARILLDVWHQHYFLVQRGVADQALAELHRVHGLWIVAVLDGDLHLQHPGVFIEQHDAEDAVVDHSLDEVRESREQLVRIENGRHLAADLGEGLQRFGVLAFRFEQPRGGNALGDVRAKLAEDPFVAFGEGAQLVAQQVERANHLALVAQRDGELRLGARDHRQVAGVGIDVVQQDWALLGDRGADNALAKLQGEVLDDFLGIADRVGNAQLFALLVQQIHREHGELGEARDQLGNSLEKGMEVEHGADLASKLRENGQQFGIRGRAAGSAVRRGFSHCSIVLSGAPRVYFVTQS